MAKTFRPYSPDQLLLLPPSLREWLPADHPVYLVNDLVETLDLEPILSSYGEERGFPPYHPVLMTKLIVYGMSGVCAVRAKCSRLAWRTWPFGSWRLDKPPTFARSRPSVPAIWRRWKEPSLRCCTCAVRRACGRVYRERESRLMPELLNDIIPIQKRQFAKSSRRTWSGWDSKKPWRTSDDSAN